MLFHVSEEPGIERFEPRPRPEGGDAVVWAIDESHLRNYLLPRDCPRVTYAAGRETTTADVVQFLGTRPAVVAIEEAWLERVRVCRLHCYHLPTDTFASAGESAGYFVSRVPVVPTRVDVIDDAVAELLRRGVDLRVVPSLWPLRDAVVASTLEFSIIRMRNAQPRQSAARLGT